MAPADFDIGTNVGSAEIFGLFDTVHIVGGRFQVVVVMLPGGSVEVSTVRDGSAQARANTALTPTRFSAGAASINKDALACLR
ncbi:hypothetical protein [Janthinobacterium sp. PAMC25594]|uniref:hypothetical protein n=1 Tax=Janthinobacterium sp. PAMC25594 TaxID=2861284 RepID=UPI002158ECE3|nr:hypothetical protein [Janthinobacterium sp. PAMC25594]